MTTDDKIRDEKYNMILKQRSNKNISIIILKN